MKWTFASLFGKNWLWKSRRRRGVTIVRARPKPSGRKAFVFELKDGRQFRAIATRKAKAKTKLMKALRGERGHGGRIEPYPIARCRQAA